MESTLLSWHSSHKMQKGWRRSSYKTNTQHLGLETEKICGLVILKLVINDQKIVQFLKNYSSLHFFVIESFSFWILTERWQSGNIEVGKLQPQPQPTSTSILQSSPERTQEIHFIADWFFIQLLSNYCSSIFFKKKEIGCLWTESFAQLGKQS